MKRSKRLGEDWEPRWKTRMSKHEYDRMRERRPLYSPQLTNKKRHSIRRDARNDAMEIARKAGL